MVRLGFGRAMRAWRCSTAIPLLALVALTACGGGGGSPPAPPPPPANRAPAFTSPATASVGENVASSFYQAAATDPDGDALTYSIAGGADAARFSISASGQLSFVAPPNFDLAADADGDNVYQVQLRASDASLSATLSLAVTVTNSREGIAVTRVATGFSNATAIAPVSNDAALVAERDGAIYQLNLQTGARTLLIQIPALGSVGVTALAVAPTFAADGSFVVMFMASNGALRIQRYFRNVGGITIADPLGDVLTQAAPSYAGGGWLRIEADGRILAATGDAGGSGDPVGSAQNPAVRLGKLLIFTRNPDPFAGGSPLFYFTSTLASGLRQPNGGSAFNGGVLIADRGETTAEEINFFPAGSAGLNYGWPFKEGTRIVRGTPPAGVTDPVVEYLRGTGFRLGQAVVGGAVLRDQYVFADRSGAIFAVNLSAIQAGSVVPIATIERRDADFAPDTGTIGTPVAVVAGVGGMLYILDSDGEVFRVSAS